MGFAKITVDGAVGQETLVLFRRVQDRSRGEVMGDGSSCMGVAPDVDVIGDQLRAFGEALTA